jgi:mannose-1-phosphate guanylyltransferase
VEYKKTNLWGLILAGGDGMRLRELTTRIAGAPIPKQYCRITGDRSMLEETLARIAPLVSRTRTLVVVNRDHLPFARAQLGQLPLKNVLVQPRNRDTGPGILFGLLRLMRRDPEATLVILPSDHYVGDELAFRAHVIHSAEVVADHPEKIALLGFVPDRPEPGYGYIEPARVLANDDRSAVFRVAAFCEKPSDELARSIIQRGALWNSFVMTLRVERALELIRQIRPEDYDRMRRVRRIPATGGQPYAALPAWNFSSDFLARIPQHLLVLRVANTAWSDWGTPQAIARTFANLKERPPWMSLEWQRSIQET